MGSSLANSHIWEWLFGSMADRLCWRTGGEQGVARCRDGVLSWKIEGRAIIECMLRSKGLGGNWFDEVAQLLQCVSCSQVVCLIQPPA